MRRRVLTGYRPTGRLHLGHWHGNLKNMLDLAEGEYECFFFVADWHALTSEYADTSMIRLFTHEIVLDWLAAGLNPQQVNIYRQSDIGFIAELTMYLAMITPVPWLERVPTYKEQQQQLAGKDLSTVGFLEYPLLQTADIIAMRAELVPVGEDQLPHLEFAREVVRRFHNLYGQCFPEPAAMLSEAKRVPGTDGRKMSKSYGNTIDLMDTAEAIREKVLSYITDPKKIRKTDPGRPEICALHDLHRLHGRGDAEIESFATRCRAGELGCVEHKEVVAAYVAEDLADYQRRRAELDERPGLAEEVLLEGRDRVLPVARETIEDARRLIKLIE